MPRLLPYTLPRSTQLQDPGSEQTQYRGCSTEVLQRRKLLEQCREERLLGPVNEGLSSAERRRRAICTGASGPGSSKERDGEPSAPTPHKAAKASKQKLRGLSQLERFRGCAAYAPISNQRLQSQGRCRQDDANHEPGSCPRRAGTSRFAR
jgi:hypothetical protein